ncbi:unnamed protein product [Didymodactylos carnosus]|uniref:HAT C-terminal dimerisation domain-containing protein n=1 Tax=Didymodactylos carnosus TaxID=1234261 RepID=A0A815I799_9BILA|nr:unnamed protein product [Didymodactylos carnosus]CAF4244807.1 unnamed protein product [Didymodactylos carnosus]
MNSTEDTPVNLSSLSPCVSSTSTSYTSDSIKRSLINDKDQFKVVQNLSKRATAPCWQSFGFPAREEKNQKFEVIRGYASSARKQVSTKKEKMKYLCTRWVADSMRPFQIVSDRGFKELVQECINIGRGSRSDSFILADDILSCERTMKNEIDRLAEQERAQLREKLIVAAQDGSLCLSPDIWTDNYRKISYMGAILWMMIMNLIQSICSALSLKRKRKLLTIFLRSAAVEREFSAAGQIVNQRRSSLDPSSVNNILFLRSIENNKWKD